MFIIPTVNSFKRAKFLSVDSARKVIQIEKKESLEHFRKFLLWPKSY